MRFTTFYNRVPKVIGKYKLADGTSGTEMRYKRGAYKVTDCETLDDLADHLDALRPGSDYLCFGVPKNGEVSGNVTGYRSDDAIQKTKEHFHFAEEPGVMLIDCDGRPMEAQALRSALKAAVPALGTAAMVWLPSASSHLYKGDEPLSGLRGSHGYIGVADASDIPRAGQVLFDRLWLAGYGSVKLNTYGGQLLRSPYDRAMRVSVQPDFAAGCYCEEPYNQRRGEAQILDGVDVIDTREVLPDLNVFEARKLENIQEDAKAACRHEATAKREEYLTAQGAEIDAKPYTPERAAQEKENVRRMVDGSREALPLEWPVHFKQHRSVTVRDVLMAPAKYNGMMCFDPMNGEYFSGYIHTDARPCIYSCASGGVLYPLGTPTERAEIRRARWEAWV